VLDVSAGWDERAIVRRFGGSARGCAAAVTSDPAFFGTTASGERARKREITGFVPMGLSFDSVECPPTRNLSPAELNGFGGGPKDIKAMEPGRA